METKGLGAGSYPEPPEEKENIYEEIDPVDIYGLPGWDY